MKSVFRQTSGVGVALSCALVWGTVVAIALISVLPAEREMLATLSWAVASRAAPGAAADDRTRAMPAPQQTFRQKADLIAAGGASARGGGAAAVWSTRSHAVEVPPLLAKALMSIREAVDAVRVAALLFASDSRLESEARVAPPVVTIVQFLC
jgi:hypothetical protein